MKTTAPLLALALLVGCAGADADGDGFSATIDCDDNDNTAFPGALERCDGVDNDCNGEADDAYAAEAVVFFLDEDGDGYGTTTASQMSCANIEPPGFVANASDCNDGDNDINPGAEEICNLKDDNCNQAVDDNPTDAPTWYADNDLDGFGSRTLLRKACEGPEGWIKSGGDCDDFDFLVNPNALEFCDGFDNDCDDETDEADAEDHSVFYLDADADGFGDAQNPIDACYLPEGYAVESTDCNDDPDNGGGLQTPGVEEICQDGIDNNCNDAADQCSWENWGAETSDFVVEGFSGGYLGWAADFVGDADGDGYEDMVLGAYYTTLDARTGMGMLVYGEAEGVLTEREIDGEEEAHWHTTTSFDYFGRHVNRLGDIDRDGYDDFGIGSYTYDANGTSRSNSGVVSIIDGGKTREEERTNIEIAELPSLVGPSTSTYLGSTFGPAGDLNSDGFVDMLAGGYFYSHDGNTGAGAVWIAPGSSGRYGYEASIDAFAKYVGNERYTYLGYFGPTVGSGDLDGDSKSDIVMGAYGYNSYAGGSFIVYGTGVAPTGTNVVNEAADVALTGASSYEYVGGFLTQIPGDINDDGYDDLVVGNYRAASYAGHCYIFLGSSSEIRGGEAASRADVTIEGSGSSTYLCYGRTAVGDFNQDGSPELVVGAYRASTGGSNYNGGAYLYEIDAATFGVTVDTLQLSDASTTIDGSPGSYGYFGIQLSAGDFNGDDYDDLIVGEYGASGYAGATHVFLGNSI